MILLLGVLSFSNDINYERLDDSYLHFPTKGVNVDFFEAFVLRCGGIQALEGLNSADVWETFIRRTTSPKAQSYCDYLYEDCGTKYVGEATVLVCQTWHYKFLDVVKAILNFFESERTTIVWLDLFSVNHHRQPLISVDWLCGSFRTTLSHFNRMVLVLSPWQNPIPLNRSWCLWEIYCCTVDRSPPMNLEIAMSGKGTKAFLKSLFTSICDIHDAISAIDICNAVASNNDHSRVIRAAADSCGGGADNFNHKIRNVFYDWLYTVALDLNASMCAGVTAAGICDKIPSPAEEKYHLPVDSLTSDVFRLIERSKNYQYAISVLSTESSIRRKLYGTDHYRTLHVRSLLGRCWVATEEYDLAFECYKELLTSFSKKEEEYKTEVLDILYQLAVLYRLRNNPKSAVPILQKVVNKRAALMGWDDSKTLEAVDCLALTFEEMGKWTEAQQWRKQSVRMSSEMLGADDIRTVEAQGMLARSLMKAGGRSCTKEATRLYQLCINAHRREFGETHETTLGWMCEFALMLSQAGFVEKAEEVFSTAHCACVRDLDEHDPLAQLVRKLKSQLQTPKSSQKEMSGEYALLDEVAAPENVFAVGDSNPSDLGAINQPGVLLLPIICTDDVQDVLAQLNVTLTEAEHMYRKVLRTKKENLSSRNPSVLTSMHSLAVILHYSRNLSAAESLFREVIRKGNKHLSPSHPIVLDAKSELANVLRDELKFDAAIVLYRDVLAELSRAAGRNDSSLQSLKYNLAHTIAALYSTRDSMATKGEDDLNEAMALLQDVFRFRNEHVGANHFSTLSCLEAIADILHQSGRYDDSIKYRREVVRRSSEAYGRDDPYCLAMMQALAMGLFRSSVLRRASCTALEGVHQDGTSQQQSTAASAQEAEELLNEVIQRKCIMFGKSHPSTLDAIDCLSRVLEKE